MKIFIFHPNGKVKKLTSLIFHLYIKDLVGLYFYDPIDGKWGKVIEDPDIEGDFTFQTILEKNVPAQYKTQLLLLT